MSGKSKFRIVVASLTVSALIILYFFADRPGRRVYQAYVALDGTEPWGPLYPPSETPPDFVVVYRTGHNGVVCFDTFHSKNLHNALLSKKGNPVTVEYDTWSQFGRVYGYNVRSIDGIELANGSHVLWPGILGVNGVHSQSNTDTKGACW